MKEVDCINCNSVRTSGVLDNIWNRDPSTGAWSKDKM